VTSLCDLNVVLKQDSNVTYQIFHRKILLQPTFDKIMTTNLIHFFDAINSKVIKILMLQQMQIDWHYISQQASAIKVNTMLVIYRQTDRQYYLAH